MVLCSVLRSKYIISVYLSENLPIFQVPIFPYGPNAPVHGGIQLCRVVIKAALNFLCGFGPGRSNDPDMAIEQENRKIKR